MNFSINKNQVDQVTKNQLPIPSGKYTLCLTGFNWVGEIRGETVPNPFFNIRAEIKSEGELNGRHVRFCLVYGFSDDRDEKLTRKLIALLQFSGIPVLSTKSPQKLAEHVQDHIKKGKLLFFNGDLEQVEDGYEGRLHNLTFCSKA